MNERETGVIPEMNAVLPMRDRGIEFRTV